jgi:hypothetical protein
MNPNNIPAGTQNQFFGQKVSVPGINVNNASDDQLILKDNYTTRLYYDAAGIPTVLLGTRPANSSNGLSVSELGLFVSQPTFDVTQATDSQLIFNSQNDVFKIVVSGTTTVTVNSGDTGTTVTTTVPHNLGYAPVVLAYVFNPADDVGAPTGYVATPYSSLSSSNTGSTPTVQLNPIAFYFMNTDTVNAYANIVCGDVVFFSQVQGTFTFKYFLLQETA